MKSDVYNEVLKVLEMSESLLEAIKEIKKLKAKIEREENSYADLWFLKDAYGLTAKTVRLGYHVKLYHDDWSGWFDWYVTTGTIVPNATEYGASRAIGKAKDAEEVGIIIHKYIKNALNYALN